METFYSLVYVENGVEYEEEYSTKELENVEYIAIRKITTNYVDYEEIEFVDFES